MRKLFVACALALPIVSAPVLKSNPYPYAAYVFFIQPICPDTYCYRDEPGGYHCESAPGTFCYNPVYNACGESGCP